MKNKIGISSLIAAILLSAGVFFSDVREDLPVHETKEYNIRSLERDLFITFHHTATEGQSLEDIAAYHVEKRGWAGIAYHFAINDKGEVSQLQDINEITFHTRGHNTEAIGIVFIGNYEERELPQEAVDAAKILIDALCQELNIIGVRSHSDVKGAATLCMGKYAKEKMSIYLY